MRVYNPPQFAVPRVRTLVFKALGAGCATLFFGGIICILALSNQPFMLKIGAVATLFYAFFLLLILPLLSKSWRPALLLGLPPERTLFRSYLFVVIFLVGAATFSSYLVYLPLSYIVPDFVEWYLLDQPELISSTSVLSNLSSFFMIVVLAPVFEEFIFRGLLLTRWSIKWNTRRAILLSSLLFGIGHADLLGAFFFGYAMCVIYIRTKSLLIPICIHAANNGIVWLMNGVDLLITGSEANPTISEFQSYWWVGLVAGVIAAPWVVGFISRSIPEMSSCVPYLALQASEQETDASAQKCLSRAA